MKSNDLTMNRDDVRARLMQALSDNDKDAYNQAFNDMILCIENDINQRQTESVDEIRGSRPQSAGTARSTPIDQRGKEVLPEAGRGHAQHEPQAGAFKYRSGYAKNHHECGV